MEKRETKKKNVKEKKKRKKDPGARAGMENRKRKIIARIGGKTRNQKTKHSRKWIYAKRKKRRERESACKMAEGSSSTDIQRVLAAIKSSEASFFFFSLSFLFLFVNFTSSMWSQILGFYVQIVEDRVELFNDLRRIELKNVSESDYGSVINCLVVSLFAFFQISVQMHVNSKLCKTPLYLPTQPEIFFPSHPHNPTKTSFAYSPIS